MLLLIGVALAQTRVASYGFETATGANGGTLLRLPVCEDASVFENNSCYSNKLNTGTCQNHCTPPRCASSCAARSQMPSARSFTAVDVGHSTRDRPIPVTEHFLQAVCSSSLISTCSTGRAAPFSVVDHTDRHLKDPFRLLPAHGFTHAQMRPSPTTQGAPDLLSEGLLMIFSTLARHPVHGHINVTRQPSRRTHIDVRYRRLQRHGFTGARTVLLTTPHPDQGTPSKDAMLCSSSAHDGVRRHYDETYAPWRETHFTNPSSPQPNQEPKHGSQYLSLIHI